jgi:hypothetical protein
MAERYLNRMNKQRAVTKQNLLNNSEQTKEQMKKKAKYILELDILKQKIWIIMK